MFARWIDPHVRRSLALAVLVLSVTGLVLADPGRSGTVWTRAAESVAASSNATGPVETGASSRTIATFDGRGARGRMALSHGRLLASGTRPMYAELRVRADEPEGGQVARAPTAVVLVIDTSGSMAGQKIADARRSAHAMLDEMRDDDQVGIVRFASEAQVLVPMGRVGDVRPRAHARIDELYASGNTDIANAVRTAASMLGWNVGDRVKRVVVVTDGRDTSGAPRWTASNVVRQQSGRGVTLSALGIGYDYDDAYLADLASAGRGNYEFLRDSSALARFLSRELRETVRTTVQDVVVQLDLPREARVRDVWGATWDGRDGGARITLGSLFAGDERRVVVSLEVQAGEPGSSVPIRANVSWNPIGGPRQDVALPALRVESVVSAEEVDNARDLSVMASVTSVITSQREAEAAAAWSRGDVARAQELNRANQADLDKAARAAPPAAKPALEAQKRAYSDDARHFAAPPPAAGAPSPARDIGARERKNADRAYGY